MSPLCHQIAENFLCTLAASAKPHNELVAIPDITAQDFAAKIATHAHLLGIRNDGECMFTVEVPATRDARALLGASVA